MLNKKNMVIVLMVVMVSGFAVAQTPDDTPNDSPSDAPNSTGLTDLPGQASDTAKKVINAISNQFQQSFQGIGDALQNLFQNQQNISEN